MAWNKPIIREIECGMEINMSGPDADDDGVQDADGAGGFGGYAALEDGGL